MGQVIQPEPGAPPFSFAMFGQTTVTIAANQTRGVANFTLNPALTDIVLTNYQCFGNVRSTTGAAQVLRTVRLNLSSVSVLAIEAFRNFNSATLSSVSTGLTVAGLDLLNVSGMAVIGPEPGTVNDPHGGSSSFFDHGHVNQNHPTTESPHTHTVSVLTSTLGAETFTIDYLIIHA